MKNNVFLLQLKEGELKLIPYPNPQIQHIQPQEQILTPKRWREKQK